MSQVEVPSTEIKLADILQIKTLTADTPPIESTAKSFLVSLALLAFVKQGRE